MGDIGGLGRTLVAIGIGLVVIGLLIIGTERLFPLGRLPGDILIRKGNTTVYIPLVSSLLISLILSILLRLLRR